MIEPLKNFMPRRATFLLDPGMRSVIDRPAASLKSAITLAPLRSTPGPIMLFVTSIWIGRFSRTLPPVQLSTSPVENLERSAASKSAGSAAAEISVGPRTGSLLWANAADEPEDTASADAQTTK